MISVLTTTLINACSIKIFKSNKITLKGTQLRELIKQYNGTKINAKISSNLRS